MKKDMLQVRGKLKFPSYYKKAEMSAQLLPRQIFPCKKLEIKSA